MYRPIEKEIFHVHTWRCKHAGEEKDYEYVEAAIRLGANRIVFTDHAPFPGNPFHFRMDIEQLPEYVQSMQELKKAYASKIEVLAGLELEYLPRFDEYYKKLRESGAFDVILMGQHFFQTDEGGYSFNDKDKREEHIKLAEAMAAGAATGYFDVIAHPDRCYRRCREWDAKMQESALRIQEAALKHNLLLEQNYTSMSRNYQYWEEFWKDVPQERCLKGYDAHAVEEMNLA